MTDDYAGVLDLVPEGCTPVCSVRIVEYLTPEGEEERNWQVDGDPSLEHVAGLIEVVKFDVLRHMLTELVQDDDEEE